ncbi:peptidylprolyl isomerase [Urbifossiella limnaea]|uniref:peptidylprolyl isomerase n=1 Tax=Urbifossiella limnaea TaxID=2528023 RepID=A0A517XU55_9BACT|nr:peptidylprolyl isomerase [Urbifossiella limnaea]QDU21045.1 putative peptidyl-prolyl cis-trans isomerase [Urbifossiella limnaea]
MLRRLFRAPSPSRNTRCGLTGFEALEAREVPAVTLGTISQPQIPNDVPVFLPVNVTSVPAGAVTTTVSTDNASVQAAVLTGGRSVRFDVSGVDSTGAPFSGSVTIRLFEDVAPLLTQRVIDLINSGYYNGKIFHRVTDLLGAGGDNVIIQGGSPNGDGSGGSALPDLRDEYRADVRFVSNGLVAAANAGDDGNDAQFFFTDLNRPLSDQIQFLNFNHTIFGIVTDGFDTLLKMRDTPKSGSTPTTNLTINSAAVFTDTKNAVIKLTPTAGFTGTANVTVTANDGTSPTQQTFAVQGVPNPVTTTKPFITTPIPDQTTTAGTPVSFTVPVTIVSGVPTTIAVRSLAFTGTTNTIPNATVTVDSATGKVTITPNAGFTGTIEFKVGVRATSQPDNAGGTDPYANYDTQVVRLTVTAAPTTPTDPTDPTGPFTVTGSAAGTPGTVTVRNSDGSVRYSTTVFDGFTGGVRVATGDVNGDGVEDVVAVPAFGGASMIVVLNSQTGALIRTATVFENSFRGGLYVQVGDAQNLGYDQVIVGAGDSGGPRVTLLDFKRGVELLNFFAGDDNLRGGVDVELGDVFAGRGQMIVTSMGPGAGPEVSIYNAGTAAFVGKFLAGDATDRKGILVDVGDRPSSTAARPILVTPFGSPEGTPGAPFDPSKFIDPSKPASTASSGSNGIDINSLFNV